MKRRLTDINPEVDCETMELFLNENNLPMVLETSFDYVVDTIDTLTPKIELISETLKRGYPLVSSMGSGGKKDPSMVKVADFSHTFNCNLSRNLRKRLKKYDIRSGFNCVFSNEKVEEDTLLHLDNERNKKTSPGTVSYMPALFGCWISSVVIRELINEPIHLSKSPYKSSKPFNELING
jgi:tRNA A37 threonylcarbamoyladenosine dehydratase